MLQSDGTKNCSVLTVGRETPFYFIEKKLSKSYANYHDDKSGIVFEDWFENTLTPSLLKERKVVVVMDNAK